MPNIGDSLEEMATPTRIELALSAVTGRRVNRYTTGPSNPTDANPRLALEGSLAVSESPTSEVAQGNQTTVPATTVPAKGFEPKAHFARPVTPEMAEASAIRLINSHFRQKPEARASIPVEASDDDVIVMDYLRNSRAVLSSAQELVTLVQDIATAVGGETGGLVERARAAIAKAVSA